MVCLLPGQSLRKQKCSVTAVQPMVRGGFGLTVRTWLRLTLTLQVQGLLNDQRKAAGPRLIWWLGCVSCSVSLPALQVMLKARLCEVLTCRSLLSPGRPCPAACDPLLLSQDQPSCASESH